MAQQDKVLYSVTAQQYKPVAGVDRRNLDDGQASLSASSLSSKGRRYANATQSEPAQHESQQPDQAEDEKQRQNESDVVNIHE